MTGGYNYAESEFNRATRPCANGQPLNHLSLAALDAGFSPTTRILDAPLVVDQGRAIQNGSLLTTKRFYGPSIMRLGIENRVTL